MFVVEKLFKALADPTRIAILDALSDQDGQTLFELCQRLLLQYKVVSSRQAISQHLSLLEDAKLVQVRREGRYKFHYINTEPLNTVQRRWNKEK